MADTEELKLEKKRIRKDAKARTAALDPAYCRDADDAIFRNLTALPEYEAAKTIFCFVSMASEVNTRPILQDAWTKNKLVCVPKCLSLGHMEAYPIHSMEDLQPGTWGILEPKEGIPFIDPSEIDFAVVPCCAASADGRRLGFGGGYYDRFLARTEAFRAILCREKILRSDIPIGPYDLPMDAVVTETGVRRITGK